MQATDSTISIEVAHTDAGDALIPSESSAPLLVAAARSGAPRRIAIYRRGGRQVAAHDPSAREGQPWIVYHLGGGRWRLAIDVTDELLDADVELDAPAWLTIEAVIRPDGTVYHDGARVVQDEATSDAPAPGIVAEAGAAKAQIRIL